MTSKASHLLPAIAPLDITVNLAHLLTNPSAFHLEGCARKVSIALLGHHSLSIATQANTVQPQD